MPATSKEIQPLIDLAKKGGYKIVPSGRQKHMKVLGPKGNVVIDENGPVIVSGTPGERRDRDLTVNRWIKAGIIPYDPWKPPKEKQQNGKENPLTRDDVKQKKIEALQRESDRRREETAKLRMRLEPLVAKLGGWGAGRWVTFGTAVVPAELGTVAWHWLSTRGRVEAKEAWKHGDTGAQQTALNLRRGDTLSDKPRIAFELFVEELEKAYGPQQDADKLRKRYFDLLREAKGLKAVHAHVEAGEPITEVGDTRRERELIEEAAARARREQPAPLLRMPHLVQTVQQESGLSFHVAMSFEDYGDLCQAIGNFEAFAEKYGDAGRDAVEKLRKLRKQVEQGRTQTTTGGGHGSSSSDAIEG